MTMVYKWVKNDLSWIIKSTFSLNLFQLLYYLEIYDKANRAPTFFFLKQCQDCFERTHGCHNSEHLLASLQKANLVNLIIILPINLSVNINKALHLQAFNNVFASFPVSHFPINTTNSFSLSFCGKEIKQHQS